MNSWMFFLLKSTLILSMLYLFFRLLIRQEAFFNQSRIILVLIVAVSVIIPFIYLPSTIGSIVPNKLDPIFQSKSTIEEPILTNNQTLENIPSLPASDSGKSFVINPQMVFPVVYLAGVLVSLFLFIYRLSSVLLLIGKARSTELNGIRLMIANDDIPAFSFRKYILISQSDYETNSEAILTHELSHIRQGHFYDLMLMELVKIIYWFNPIVYMMFRDMKDIHEFQADELTINSGIDAAKYQLLIIQKSVGHQKFALANSFNHCQIKNRITMMNKSKNGKVWNWKVATFLPLLVLLLMAFGRKGEKFTVERILPEKVIPSSEIVSNQNDRFKQKIEIKRDGNFIDNKSCSVEEIALQDQAWRKASNDWIFLSVDESIPLKRIDEVRGALEGNYWVVQSTVNSDELVYFAGDVNQLAKFNQGRFGDWFDSKLHEITKGKFKETEYKISISMIIDKSGKVRDGHVTSECEYPEINSAYNEILSQIPDWEPASRGGDDVSVYYAAIIGHKTSE